MLELEEGGGGREGGEAEGEEEEEELYSSVVLCLASCPEQLNQQISQNEIGTESWAHCFVSLFSLCSSFLGLMAQLNSKLFLFQAPRAAEILSTFSASQLLLSARVPGLLCCISSWQTPPWETDAAQ